MAEEADVAAHSGVVGGEIDPEDVGFAGGDRQEAGAGPEQAGLPRTVGAENQDDLAGLDREIDPGKGGEAAGECDGSAELDDGGHGLRHHGRGAGCRGSKRQIPGRVACPGPGTSLRSHAPLRHALRVAGPAGSARAEPAQSDVVEEAREL